MEPLAGGNVNSNVVRMGDTVRRPTGPWTPGVHALLRHLHAIGFAGAPMPLGVDDEGREVLTFTPGVVPWPDRFDLLERDDQVAHVGGLIRDLHDASASFTPSPDAQWQVLIPADGNDLIIHHDLAPWNLVVSDPQWVFIDWDMAAPGTRLWDLAYAAHGFVPLTADPRWHHLDHARRLRTLVDGYGLDEDQRRELVSLLARPTWATYHFLAAQAETGVLPWAEHWRTGHGDAWYGDAAYTEQRASAWERALLG